MLKKKKNLVAVLGKVTKIVNLFRITRSNTTCLWHTCYDPAAMCMWIWVVLCPFFDGMQTAGAGEHINETHSGFWHMGGKKK